MRLFSFPAVVGYNTSTSLDTGASLITASFNTVGATQSFKLSDIRGTESASAGGDLSLTVLDPSGATAVFTEEEAQANPDLADYVGMEKVFCWYVGGWRKLEAGWYNEDGDEKFDADKIVFNAGDAFWVSGNGESLQTAGQVGSSDVQIDTPDTGSIAVGNPFPCNLQLSRIYGTEDVSAGGDLSLTVLDPSGATAVFTEEEALENPALAEYVGTEKVFCWYVGGWRKLAAGWYNEDGDEKFDAENIIFKPGESLWVSGNGESFVMPAPSL